MTPRCKWGRCPKPPHAEGAALCQEHLTRVRRRRNLQAVKGRDMAAHEPGAHDAAVRREAGQLEVSTTPTAGGISHSPAQAWAYLIRRKMRPIRIAPTLIRDGAGRLIARIVVDPVTGQRTRERLTNHEED